MNDYRQWKRITKYNPAYRTEQGVYRRSEWTSSSDVGRVFGEQVFTQEAYIQVETAYVQAVHLLLTGATPITVVELEVYGNSPDQQVEPTLHHAWQVLQEGATLSVHELEPVVRLILREHLWCYLVDSTQRVKLRFGYDYYMYVNYDQIPSQTFTTIEALGLFVD